VKEEKTSLSNIISCSIRGKAIALERIIVSLKVKIILNVAVVGPSHQKQGTWYHFELLLHIKCKKLNHIACKRFVNL
jgi:hypothetical protein